MERKLRVDYTKFTNCLRIAIVPDELQDERIADVKKFCLKHGFSNVMLFFNAEEYNVGHITKTELRPWLDTIKKAKRVLERAGISVSLNPWMELGHLARGRELKCGQTFVTMVDMNGVQSELVVCPWDENWRKYYFDMLGWYLTEVNPDVLWIEDDFRLHNHYPLEFGGCFCKHHMARYNEKLGANYTREQLVEKLFAKGGCTAERKAWLDVSRETILDIAKQIGDFIRALGLKTRVGLMSSMPSAHCMEARDWMELHIRLSAGEERINRIHLPCYFELTGKDYFQKFNANSMVVRSFLSEDTYIYPELENGAFSNFMKDGRFLQFQLESAAPLLISGMTYDIFDFVGNGTIASFGYGEAVKNVSPYLQGVMELGLKFSSLDGVKVVIDEKACYYREIENGWKDLRKYDEFEAGAYLGGLGINYAYTKEKALRGETVFLMGTGVNLFTDVQIEALFADNYVILDGSAVLKLKARGLLRLIGATEATRYPVGCNTQAYEQAVDGYTVQGKTHYRASCFEKAGDYVSVQYAEEVAKKMRVLTEIYNNRREYFGVGAVLGERFAVLPFDVTNPDETFERYNPLRRENMYSFVREFRKGYVLTDVCAINPYVYRREKDSVAIIVNATVNEYKKLTFFTDIPFEKMFAVDRKGKLTQKTFTREGERVTVNMPIEYLSTATLVLA